jgi:hypothetical protein
MGRVVRSPRLEIDFKSNDLIQRSVESLCNQRAPLDPHSVQVVPDQWLSAPSKTIAPVGSDFGVLDEENKLTGANNDRCFAPSDRDPSSRPTMASSTPTRPETRTCGQSGTAAPPERTRSYPRTSCRLHARVEYRRCRIERRLLIPSPRSRLLEISSDLPRHRFCLAVRGRKRRPLRQVVHSSKFSLVLLRYEPETLVYGFTYHASMP